MSQAKWVWFFGKQKPHFENVIVFRLFETQTALKHKEKSRKPNEKFMKNVYTNA